VAASDGGTPQHHARRIDAFERLAECDGGFDVALLLGVLQQVPRQTITATEVAIVEGEHGVAGLREPPRDRVEPHFVHAAETVREHDQGRDPRRAVNDG
jgi:hypothetical protein